MSFDARRTVTVSVTLPTVSLGASYSFTVTVTGARVGDCAIVNPPTGLLASLSQWAANVTASDTVTISLKAGLAITTGAQSFVVGVL